MAEQNKKKEKLTDKHTHEQNSEQKYTRVIYTQGHFHK